MKFFCRIYSIGFVCSVLFSAAIISAFAQTPSSQPLVLNQTAEDEVKGGEAQSYIVQIGANQTARIEVVQKGIEISLAAYKPGGERFIESESPSGSFGNRHLSKIN